MSTDSYAGQPVAQRGVKQQQLSLVPVSSYRTAGASVGNRDRKCASPAAMRESMAMTTCSRRRPTWLMREEAGRCDERPRSSPGVTAS